MNDLLMKLKTPKDRSGSKPRCHWLTHGTRERVANRLTGLVKPWGAVSVNDRWMPDGFCRIEEAQLHKVPELLSQEDFDRLGDWWLAVRSDTSQTPNWDIVSTCRVNGHMGMLLVEAKAHNKELKAKDKATAGSRNFSHIGNCMERTNVSLANQTKPGWALSHEHHYQMSNRFAWAWKLTELGYPVILIYLGFLNTEEMCKGKERRPLSDHAEWECLVKDHSQSLFSEEVWDRQWSDNGQPFVPCIRSLEMAYDVPIED